MKRSEWWAFGGIAASIAALVYTIGRDMGWTMSSAPKTNTGDSYRDAVISAAKTQVGKADLNTYFADAAPMYVGQKPSWCGIFALWALHQAGLAKGIMWKVGLGFLYRLKQTTDPKPGDLAYFDKNQHHAIIADVRGDEVDLINGNGSGGMVSLSTAPKSKARAYYSIQSLIDEAGA